MWFHAGIRGIAAGMDVRFGSETRNNWCQRCPRYSQYGKMLLYYEVCMFLSLLETTRTLKLFKDQGVGFSGIYRVVADCIFYLFIFFLLATESAFASYSSGGYLA